MVFNVGEQSEAAIISRTVKAMKLVHTNDLFEQIIQVFNKGGLHENTKTTECWKCGEKLKHQSPFFQHVITDFKCSSPSEIGQQLFLRPSVWADFFIKSSQKRIGSLF